MSERFPGSSANRPRQEKPSSDVWDIEQTNSENIFEVGAVSQGNKKVKLELFNRSPNTNIGYGNRLSRKPNKRTLNENGARIGETETPTKQPLEVTDRHPDGRIIRMERKGIDSDVKYGAELPEGFKEKSFRDSDNEWDEREIKPETDELSEYGPKTLEQKQELGEAIRAMFKGLIPDKILKAASLSALVAFASMSQDEKKEVAEGYSDTESVANVSDGRITQVDIELPMSSSDEVVSESKQATQFEPRVEVELKIPEIQEVEPQVEFISEMSTEPDPRDQNNDSFTEEVKDHEEEISPADITLTKQFADKPVVGAEEYTRQEYIVEAIEFEEWNEEDGTGVPPVAAKEIRRLLVGLCAKESRFDASRVSSAGAKGIFQITAENWVKYNGVPGKETSLIAQVDVAGRMISDFYRYVNNEIGRESLDLLRSKYPDDDSFQKDLIVPLVLNSYNSGSGRIGEAVRFYIKETRSEDMPKGKELYQAIADFAYQSKEGKYLPGYGPESRGYVPELTALNNKLSKDQSDRKM